MTFETVYDAGGETVHLVDGYPVPEAVYDALRPSRLFPARSWLTEAEALAAVETIKLMSPPPPPHEGPYLQTAVTGASPLRSDALAVHTSQIPAVMARNKRHGLSVRYDRAGRPVFTDAGQRRKLMKIEGVRQLNSYYGH